MYTNTLSYISHDAVGNHCVWKLLSHVLVRTLEWVAIPFSKGVSQPRDRTQVSHVAGGFFTRCSTRKDKPVPTCSARLPAALAQAPASSLEKPTPSLGTQALLWLWGTQGVTILSASWPRGTPSRVSDTGLPSLKCPHAQACLGHQTHRPQLPQQKDNAFHGKVCFENQGEWKRMRKGCVGWVRQAGCL